MATKTEAAKLTDAQITEILARPYSWVVRPDESGLFTAKIAEFPGCITEGDTAEEALSNLREVARDWVRASAASRYSIPDPSSIELRQSGKFLIRTTRSLHRKLMEGAEQEGVSFNQYVSTLLAEAVGMRTATTAVHSSGVTILNEPVQYAMIHGELAKAANTNRLDWENLHWSMSAAEAVSRPVMRSTQSRRSRRERSPDA